MQQYCDSVERDAATRLGCDPTSDLDAFVHLAWRRNHGYGFVHFALGRGGVSKQMRLQTLERRRDRFVGGRRQRGCANAERIFEQGLNGSVAGGNRGENRGRTTGKRSDKIAVERALRINVEQQDRKADEARRIDGERGASRNFQHPGAIDQLRVGQLGVELRQSCGNRLASAAQRSQIVSGDVVPSKFDQCARERARKAGTIEHRREILKRSRWLQTEDCARGDCFGRESVGGREAGVGEFLTGEQSDQAIQGQAMNTEHRAARQRKRAHEVVGCLLD